jgi:hypothetical protein
MAKKKVPGWRRKGAQQKHTTQHISAGAPSEPREQDNNEANTGDMSPQAVNVATVLPICPICGCRYEGGYCDCTNLGEELL